MRLRGTVRVRNYSRFRRTVVLLIAERPSGRHGWRLDVFRYGIPEAILTLGWGQRP